MSIHLGAKPGAIAPTVLLPGDPLRAKYIAENFLENAVCYNEVRGMLGYTGTYQGQAVSVQGTGMGIPSISIYIHELMESYGVQQLIRVGSCGAMREEVKVRDVIIALSASTDSSFNQLRFKGLDFAPTAHFDLVKKAYESATSKGSIVHVGSVFTTDTFYNEDPEVTQRLAAYQTLAVEMETSALYTLAAKFNRKALSILTVSDHLITGEETTAAERETTFRDMIDIALETAIRV
ncbi:purine-nucleoside phosphorylase [Ammoniphilus oxalaticus]|uniref:Purine nucleoside phosphorylase DeoD-type n=1 Tax=Ammoniphilus oxalaticus TaxID=66863 RepID=A0A419SK52_9BACL|nr:purine-nucleoside phosphorylase [Ammoniphilus oxalaticus]RKD24421.1 purine-nucleoside phosphorylase [Ammoniphilus oxalaticus]